MSLIDLLSKSDLSLEEFVTPILVPGISHVVTWQNDLPYWFEVEADHPDWYIVSNSGRIVREAFFSEKQQFLDRLPQIKVITIESVSQHEAICIPFNFGDGIQKDWPMGRIRTMYLRPIVTSKVTIDQVRFFGGHLIYEEAVYNPNVPTLLHAIEEAIQENIVDSLTPEGKLAARICIERNEEAQKQAQAAKIRFVEDDSIEDQLAFSGAKLIGLSRSGQRFNVEWEYDGARFTAVAGADGRAISAGICLNDTDSHHTLTSLTQVMQEARRQRRFDLNRELYL